MALSDVSIRLDAGSIHALLGENGAGKSTLIKIITGVHTADSGALLIGDAPVDLHGAHHAAIVSASRVVHQERNLIPRFSVGENILLERLGPSALSPVDYRAVHAEAKRWLDMLGLDLDPRHARRAACRSRRCRWSRSPRRCRSRSQACCCSTSPPPRSPRTRPRRSSPLLRQLRDERRRHRLRQPQARGGARDLRRGHGAARRPQCLRRAGRWPASAAQDLVRLMIGRSERIPDLGGKRAHRRRRARAGAARHRDRARPPRRRPQPARAARSSGSTAWSAPAAASSPARSSAAPA